MYAQWSRRRLNRRIRRHIGCRSFASARSIFMSFFSAWWRSLGLSHAATSVGEGTIRSHTRSNVVLVVDDVVVDVVLLVDGSVTVVEVVAAASPMQSPFPSQWSLMVEASPSSQGSPDG